MSILNAIQNPEIASDHVEEISSDDRAMTRMTSWNKKALVSKR